MPVSYGWAVLSDNVPQRSPSYKRPCFWLAELPDGAVNEAILIFLRLFLVVAESPSSLSATNTNADSLGKALDNVFVIYQSPC